MISHHEVVVGCSVHERKHRVAKKFAENIRGVGENFESSILKEVLYMNVQDLRDKDFDQLHVGLVQPIPANPRLTWLLQSAMGLHGMVMCARRAHYELGCICAVDDFAIFPSEEGILVRKVCFFASINHMNLACVQIWDAKGGNEFV